MAEFIPIYFLDIRQTNDNQTMNPCRRHLYLSKLPSHSLIIYDEFVLNCTNIVSIRKRHKIAHAYSKRSRSSPHEYFVALPCSFGQKLFSSIWIFRASIVDGTHHRIIIKKSIDKDQHQGLYACRIAFGNDNAAPGKTLDWIDFDIPDRIEFSTTSIRIIEIRQNISIFMPVRSLKLQIPNIFV